MVTLQVDEGAGDKRQFASGAWIVVGVKLDERLVDDFGAIFLADQIEQLRATEIALEFDGCVGSGVFEFSDGFVVTAGDGVGLRELVTNGAGVG